MSLQKICLDESAPSEDLTSSDEGTHDTSDSINNQDQTRQQISQVADSPTTADQYLYYCTTHSMWNMNILEVYFCLCCEPRCSTSYPNLANYFMKFSSQNKPKKCFLNATLLSHVIKYDLCFYLQI